MSAESGLSDQRLSPWQRIMFNRILSLVCLAMLASFGIGLFWLAFLLPVSIGFSVGTLGLFCIIACPFLGSDGEEFDSVTVRFPNFED